MKRVLISFILFLLVFRVFGQDITGYWGTEMEPASGVSVGTVFQFNENGSAVVIIVTQYISTDGKERQLTGAVPGVYSIEDDIMSLQIDIKSVYFGLNPAKIYTNYLYESIWAYVSMLPSESTLKFHKDGESPFWESEEWGQLIKLATNDNTAAQTATQRAVAGDSAEQAEAQRDGGEKTGAERLAAQQEKDGLAAARAEKERLAAEKAEPDRLASQQKTEETEVVTETPKKQTKKQEVPATPIEPNGNQLVRKGSKIYFADSGNLVSSNDLTNSSARQVYEKGSSLMNTGKYMFIASGVGLALGGAGLGMMMGENDSTYTIGMVSFVSGIVVSSASAITGLILRMNGKSKIEKAINIETNGYTSTVSFGMQQNGMGLALNF